RELARSDLPACEIAEFGRELEIGSIPAEADVAGDLGRATDLGLEEIELRQLDRQVELACRRFAATGHDEGGARAVHPRRVAPAPPSPGRRGPDCPEGRSRRLSLRRAATRRRGTGR